MIIVMIFRSVIVSSDGWQLSNSCGEKAEIIDILSRPALLITNTKREIGRLVRINDIGLKVQIFECDFFSGRLYLLLPEFKHPICLKDIH